MWLRLVVFFYYYFFALEIQIHKEKKDTRSSMMSTVQVPPLEGASLLAPGLKTEQQTRENWHGVINNN